MKCNTHNFRWQPPGQKYAYYEKNAESQESNHN